MIIIYIWLSILTFLVLCLCVQYVELDRRSKQNLKHIIAVIEAELKFKEKVSQLLDKAMKANSAEAN